MSAPPCYVPNGHRHPVSYRRNRAPATHPGIPAVLAPAGGIIRFGAWFIAAPPLADAQPPPPDHGTGLGRSREAHPWRPLSPSPAPLAAADCLQRGHGRGASPSKPSIRVVWSHSPHHGRRDGRRRCGRGSSAGDSRAASTAYGLRAPPVFARVKPASAWGVQPAFSAAVTAGRAGPAGRRSVASHRPGRRSTHRLVHRRRQPPPRRRVRRGGGFLGRFLGPFGCSHCTP